MARTNYELVFWIVKILSFIESVKRVETSSHTKKTMQSNDQRISSVCQ